MIQGMRVLALIPARGGSKGVPGKNIRLAGGKPLIAWTISAAKQSKWLDRTILSSDDPEIIKVARSLDCDVPFIREAHLAKDETPGIEVVLDALRRCPGFDWVVLLQPTSPLRTAQDIDCALERCIETGAPACVSVCAAQENPYWMFTLAEGGHLSPLLPGSTIARRQDLPRVYALNGAVYVAKAEWLLQQGSFITSETVAYEMPRERSLDIDTEEDFVQLQLLAGDLKLLSSEKM